MRLCSVHLWTCQGLVTVVRLSQYEYVLECCVGLCWVSSMCAWWRPLLGLHRWFRNHPSALRKVVVMHQLPGVRHHLDGLYPGCTPWDGDAILQVLPVASEELRIHFCAWWLVQTVNFIPSGYGRRSKIAQGMRRTFDAMCLYSVLGRSRFLTNIRLFCPQCKLAFVTARSVFVDHMYLCRRSIVLLS